MKKSSMVSIKKGLCYFFKNGEMKKTENNTNGKLVKNSWDFVKTDKNKEAIVK